MIIGRGGHYRQLMAEGCDPNADLIAIGNCEAREKEALAHGGPFDKFVSIRAILFTPSSGFGQGTQICAGAVINALVTIGEHCIIGNNAVVSHDCVLEDYTFVGPGAVVCGGVTLKKGCFIGAGAVVTPGAVVPAGKLVKAGERWSWK